MSTIKVDTIATRTGSGNITLSNSLASATVAGDLTVDTNTLKVNASTNRVGIGTVSPPQKFVVSNAGADNIVMAENSSASIQMFMQAQSGVGAVGTLTNHDTVFLSNNSEKGRFLAGGGLTFNGDTAAANALSDYEEGTFTPTFNAVSSNPTVTYTGQQGNYVLVGKLIFVNANLSWSSFSGGSGLLRVGNFPYEPKLGNGNRALGSIAYIDALSGLTNAYGLEPHTNISSAANGTYFYYKGSNGNIASYVGVSNIKSSGSIQVCLVYQVS